MTRWIVTFSSGRSAGKVVIDAPNIVEAILYVCESEEIAHRAVTSAKAAR